MPDIFLGLSPGCYYFYSLHRDMIEVDEARRPSTLSLLVNTKKTSSPAKTGLEVKKQHRYQWYGSPYRVKRRKIEQCFFAIIALQKNLHLLL